TASWNTVYSQSYAVCSGTHIEAPTYVLGPQHTEDGTSNLRLRFDSRMRGVPMMAPHAVRYYETEMDNVILQPNAEPFLNSVTPNGTMTIAIGDSQLFSADVNDTDGDSLTYFSFDGGTTQTESFLLDTSSYIGEASSGPYSLDAWTSDEDYNSTLIGVATIYLDAIPIVNSVSPAGITNLGLGQTQLFTADVTDADVEALYSWTVNGTEICTTANCLINTTDLLSGSVLPGLNNITLTTTDADGNYSSSQTQYVRLFNNSACNDDISVTCEWEGALTSTIGTTTIVFSDVSGIVSAGEVVVSDTSVYVDSGSVANNPASIAFTSVGDTTYIPYKDGEICANCGPVHNDGDTMSFDVEGFSNYTYGPANYVNGTVLYDFNDCDNFSACNMTEI
ncbi:MAG: hypothetical protein KAH13_02195, partial [Tenericutes bacterium]|nr:hypothetical protein [Mycoplasmatota bacterium]